MTWQDQAACRGAGRLFFAPEYEQPEARRIRIAQAQQICRTCPVAGPCKEAGEHEDFGIWGGKPTPDRRRTTRRLNPIKHGTNSGWVAHRRRGEEPCEACVEARRIEQRVRVSAWRARQRGAA